jgi:hypothetical protein
MVWKIWRQLGRQVDDRWPNLGPRLASIVQASRERLGDIYSSAARVITEHKEAFEDRLAERKAAEALTQKSAQQDSPLAQIGAVVARLSATRGSNVPARIFLTKEMLAEAKLLNRKFTVPETSVPSSRYKEKPTGTSRALTSRSLLEHPIPTPHLNGSDALGPIGMNGDIQIFFPGPDRIQIKSLALFSDPLGPLSRQFIERAFLAAEVESVEIEGRARRAEISIDPGELSWRKVLRKISRLFSQSDDLSNGHSSLVLPQVLSDSKEGLLRIYRYGAKLSTWAVKHETIGRIRFQNVALRRKRELFRAIERELSSVPGVDRYETNDLTASVLIIHDNLQIQKHQLIEIPDDVLQKSDQIGKTPADLDFPLATASVGLAAASEFLAPVFGPLSAGVFVLLGRSKFQKRP